MKVLFVIPKFKDARTGDTIPQFPHVGIAYLMSVLKQNNVEVKVFDESIEKGGEKLLEYLNTFDPYLVGVTVYSYAHKYAYDTIDLIKANSKYPVVAGGPHVSVTTKEILESTKADFAVKGEGEYTLLELLKEMQDPESDFSRIDGLIWRNNEQEIVENKDRAFIQELDDLPFPDFESFHLDRYPCYSRKAYPLVTSRGCPYGCIFCSVRKCMGRRFRSRSADNVIKEIEYWYKRGWNNFDIQDDCFTFNIDRAEKICDLIIERGIKINIGLYNGTRVDRVNEELLRKMKQAGCNFIYFGCETGNEAILKTIKKGIKLEQVRNSVEWANKVGINNAVNFIIGHPGETYDNAMDSIKFARSLPTNLVNFYNLIPYPGTEVFEWIEKNGNILVPVDVYLENVLAHDTVPVFETKEFTKTERIKVLKTGFALAERTQLEFRLGKFWGYIGYLFTRNKSIKIAIRKFVFENNVGIMIYRNIFKT